MCKCGKPQVFNFFNRFFNIGKKKTLQPILSCKVSGFTYFLYKYVYIHPFMRIKPFENPLLFFFSAYYV